MMSLYLSVRSQYGTHILSFLVRVRIRGVTSPTVLGMSVIAVQKWSTHKLMLLLTWIPKEGESIQTARTYRSFNISRHNSYLQYIAVIH